MVRAVFRFHAGGFLRHPGAVKRQNNGRTKTDPISALDTFDANGRQAIQFSDGTCERMVHGERRGAINGVAYEHDHSACVGGLLLQPGSVDKPLLPYAFNWRGAGW